MANKWILKMKKIVNFILIFLFILSCGSKDSSVKLIYYGHSCFEIDYNNLRIIIDPFTPERFDYKFPSSEYDIGFCSHDAPDHSYFEGITVEKIYYANGSTDEFLIKSGCDTSMQAGVVNIDYGDKRLCFWTVPSFHDEVFGEKNGVNGILCMNFDGIKIVHLGDLGHILREEQIKKIGNVDVLMIPVDSYYIISLEKAKIIVEQLKPKIVLPIHYKTKLSHNDAYKDDIEKLINMFERVKKFDSSILKINTEMLNTEPHLLIMDYMKDNNDLK